jgi:hypothetical protein
MAAGHVDGVQHALPAQTWGLVQGEQDFSTPHPSPTGLQPASAGTLAQVPGVQQAAL